MEMKSDLGKNLTNEFEYAGTDVSAPIIWPTPSAKKRDHQYYQITIRNIKQFFQDIQ